MSKDEEITTIDHFVLSDNVDVDIETGGQYVTVIFVGASLQNRLLFEPDEAERIAQAMLRAAAHIDPTRAKRIDVILRGAGLTP